MTRDYPANLPFLPATTKHHLTGGMALMIVFAALLTTGGDPAAGQAQVTPTRRTPPPTNTLSLPTAVDATAIPLSAIPTVIPDEEIGPAKYPENINALTGLPFPNEEAKKRRNLIVKVSNFPYIVRPQHGLSFADIVYEYEVEGGVTRFAAIYRSQGTEFVGSVRSARLPDLDLVVMFNALLAYSGANDNVQGLLLKTWPYKLITPMIGDNCPPFCRIPQPAKPFEHTLFGNTYKMWDVATTRNTNEGFVSRGLAFATPPDTNGTPIRDIAIKWYGDQDMRWQYDPATGKYFRWNTGVPHIDAATGKQLSADNVVIIEAYHNPRPDIYESEANGSPTIEILLFGRLRAWVFRDGQWFQGEWSRRNRETPGTALTLFAADGKTSIHLKPGQTWFEVVRCCDQAGSLFGVTLADTPVDAAATAIIAAPTVAARMPKLPSDPAQATALAVQANATATISAATLFAPSVQK